MDHLSLIRYQSATLGKPVKNLLSPLAARRWEETAEVVTTLRRPKANSALAAEDAVVPRRQPALKEKYIHVEVTSTSGSQSRSSVSFSPRLEHTGLVEARPKLLNGT